MFDGPEIIGELRLVKWGIEALEHPRVIDVSGRNNRSSRKGPSA